MSDLRCTRPSNTADLQWKRVTSLQPSGAEAATLPRGHSGPTEGGKGVTNEMFFSLEFIILIL
ncbi:hypothetical protein AVEN_263314-1, partial [Araneus ventricosus]